MKIKLGKRKFLPYKYVVVPRMRIKEKKKTMKTIRGTIGLKRNKHGVEYFYHQRLRVFSILFKCPICAHKMHAEEAEQTEGKMDLLIPECPVCAKKRADKNRLIDKKNLENFSDVVKAVKKEEWCLGIFGVGGSQGFSMIHAVELIVESGGDTNALFDSMLLPFFKDSFRIRIQKE